MNLMKLTFDYGSACPLKHIDIKFNCLQTMAYIIYICEDSNERQRKLDALYAGMDDHDDGEHVCNKI